MLGLDFGWWLDSHCLVNVVPCLDPCSLSIYLLCMAYEMHTSGTFGMVPSMPQARKKKLQAEKEKTFTGQGSFCKLAATPS